MPKNKISEYSATNSANTDIGGINIDEGCAPSNINNAIREVMAQLKNFQTGASGDAFTFAGGVLISGATNTISGASVISGNINSSGTTNTFSGGNILSGTNTLSGTTIISGNATISGTTNTISGAAIITGNINSSGSANTFSGGVVHSGTNTFSSSVIISGNINSSGTNTFSSSQVISGNINSSGTNTFSGTQVISGGSTFSGAAKGSIVTDNDGSFDMTAGNNFTCTPTASFTLTFTNITSGQSGNILLVNNSNYTVSAASTTKVGTGVLTALSETGTYWISYYSNGTNVYISATGALA